MQLAVVDVPAHRHDAQRQVRILDVAVLRIINETTVVPLTSGVENKRKWQDGDEPR